MVDYYKLDDEIFDDVVVIGRFGGENSGFGVVYIVIDKNSNNMLAMKTLKNEQMSLIDFEKFKKEVIPWIEMSKHPYIVSAFTADLDDDKRPYLLMEPIFPDENGKHSLDDYMGDELSEEQILKWSIQFCYAMDFVNTKYIHGDIKPDNILISNGNIKITDFGLANPIDENNVNNYGSRYYLAPESFEGIKNISTEIYSFGMVMYQMVNLGELPFDGITLDEWEHFHKFEDVPPLDSDLFPIIKNCLEKTSENRFSSFEELNMELKKLLYEKYHQKIDKPELEDMGNITNMNRGHLAAIFRDVENCKKYYEIAISNSDNPFILFNYSLDLITLNQYVDALKILKELLMNSSNILPLDRIYFNIAICYHEKICLYKAIKYYKKVIEINKNHFKAHVNLANVYKDYGLFEESLNHYNYVLNKNPNFREALINITHLYDMMGDKINYNMYYSKLGETDNCLTTYYGALFSKDEDILSFLTSMDNSSRNYVFQIPASIQLFEFHLRNGSVSEANKKI